MLKSRLPSIANAIEPAVERAARRGAHLIADSARDRVHVRSGDLHDAIHVEEDGSDFYVVAGNGDVFYGHIIEHGSSHHGPFPFLIPAFEENIGEIVSIAKSELRGL